MQIRKIKLKWLLLTGLLAGSTVLFGQHEKYFPTSDTAVQHKMLWWNDIKFGLLMHWGPYSQWGVVESWSLCPEDEDWCRRKGPYALEYFEYKIAYENLKTTFNPTDFDPDKWAKAAWDAGMRYVVFTTKHHDGFCMFDSRETDYRITSPGCPFSSNPKANVALEIFNSFRKSGFAIGAYFSKPDWHCPDYWDPYFPPFDRNPNYNIGKYPEKWEKYKAFTYNQIKEIMSFYGKIDILWLDGGWVQPMTTSSLQWGKVPGNQDINMPKIAEMARSLQPGLIIVDRAVEGPFQDYLTPEQQIPDKPLPYPWESCITMATSWSYVPHDTYKPAYELVQLLCKIVSRGGNFLLNIGPGPNGDFDSVAYSRLKEIGNWMKINSEAIYGTAPIVPYSSGKVVFTSKGENSVYSIYLPAKEEVTMPSSVSFEGISPSRASKIYMLGYKNPLKWKKQNKSIVIEIPSSLQANPPVKYAWVFRFEV